MEGTAGLLLSVACLFSPSFLWLVSINLELLSAFRIPMHLMILLPILARILA
jgi:hypothetical protein